MRRAFSMVTGGVTIAGGLLAACGGRSQEESPDLVVSATLALATIKPFAVAIDAIGVVTPEPGAFARLAAPAEARIRRILVATGDEVRAGDPLIELDASVWQAEAARARKRVEAERHAHERAVDLAEAGIVPRKQVEAAAADLAGAEADLAAAEWTLSRAVLRAPITGVVGRMDGRIEETVDPSRALVEIIDPRGLDIVFHLSPEAAERVRRGSLVRLPGDDTATVAGIGAAVDSTGSVEVRARIVYPKEALRAGQTITGRIVIDVHPRAVVVPAASLVPAGDSLQVFVVGADSVAHARSVVVGAREVDEVEIVRGLSGREIVVAHGAYGVEEGAHIRPPSP